MSRKQTAYLPLLGFLSILLSAGCAHKSVSPSHPSSGDPAPSQGRQILLSSAEKPPMNPKYKDNPQEDSLNSEWDQFDDEFGEDKEQMSDPLVSWNRAMFYFNDKLYFWVFKPIATGYKAIAPQPVRIGVKNFFYNLAFPIRFANCLLQAKFESASNEFARFIVNTAVGLGGFLDVATKKMNIERYDEDLV